MLELARLVTFKSKRNTIGPTELAVTGNGSSGQFLSSGGDRSFSWTISSGGPGGASSLNDLSDFFTGSWNAAWYNYANTRYVSNSRYFRLTTL